jgi:C_GCAxxG_C_C family probable redox protein
MEEAVANDMLGNDMLQRLADNGRGALSRYHNCAQASFSVLQDEFHLEGGPIVKALTPFPGLASRGETCGAVIGCLMAIGLVYASDIPGDGQGYLAAVDPARRFCTRFVERNGSTACASILQANLGFSVDLTDPAQARAYSAAGGGKVCSNLVAAAVQVAGEVIAGRG